MGNGDNMENIVVTSPDQGSFAFKQYQENPQLLFAKEFKEVEEALNFLSLLGCDTTFLEAIDNKLLYRLPGEVSGTQLTEINQDGKVVFDENIMTSSLTDSLDLIELLREKRVPELGEIDEKDRAREVGEQNKLLWEFFANGVHLDKMTEAYFLGILKEKIDTIDVININHPAVEFIKVIDSWDNRDFENEIFSKIKIPSKKGGEVLKDKVLIKSIGKLRLTAQIGAMNWLDDNSINFIDIEMVNNLSNLDPYAVEYFCQKKLKIGAVSNGLLDRKIYGVLKDDWRVPSIEALLRKIEDNGITSNLIEFLPILSLISSPVQSEILAKKISREASIKNKYNQGKREIIGLVESMGDDFAKEFFIKFYSK